MPTDTTNLETVNGCPVIGMLHAECGTRYILAECRDDFTARYVVARHNLGDTEWAGGHYTDSLALALANLVRRARGRIVEAV